MISLILIFIFQSATQTKKCSENKYNVYVHACIGHSSFSTTVSFDFIEDFDFYNTVEFPSIEKQTNKQLPRYVTLWKNTPREYISLLDNRWDPLKALPIYYGCFKDDNGFKIHITSAIKIETKEEVKKKLQGIILQTKAEFYTNFMIYYQRLISLNTYDIEMQPDRIKFSEDGNQLIIIPAVKYVVGNIDFNKLMETYDKSGTPEQIMYNKPAFYMVSKNREIKEALYSIAKVIAYFEFDDLEYTLNNIDYIIKKRAYIDALKYFLFSPVAAVVGNSGASVKLGLKYMEFKNSPDKLRIITIHDAIMENIPNFGKHWDHIIEKLKSKLFVFFMFKNKPKVTLNSLMSNMLIFCDPKDDLEAYVTYDLKLSEISEIENNSLNESYSCWNEDDSLKKSRTFKENDILKEINDWKESHSWTESDYHKMILV